MLGKLIKYDLKFILKGVNIYIVILLVCTALFNITSYDYVYEIHEGYPISTPTAPVIIQVFHTIFWNAIFATIIGLIINAAVRTWGRFKNNLYHDEAYLTHTLPVNRKTLWMAKFLSAAITTSIVIAAIGLSFALLQLTPSGKDLTMAFGIGAPGSDFTFYLVFILTAFTQLLYTITCGFTGIIIANKTNKRRGFRAILCGFGVYLLGVFVLLGCFLVQGTYDPNIHAMIFGTESSALAQEIFTQSFFVRTLAEFSTLYAIMTAILYFTSQALINKGVNID